MKKNIQSLTLTLPKLTTKRVFVGGYFSHYNAVVIFHKKPHTLNKQDPANVYYDLLDNKDCIAGCISLEEFVQLFPGADLKALTNKRGLINSLEVTKLVEMEITAHWDGNKLIGFDFNLDGWQ